MESNEFRGDVMVEQRGGKEDNLLKKSYERLYLNGTENISFDRWKKLFTSRKLKVNQKRNNIAGLQLADLLAHPSRREILIDKGLVDNNRNTFGDEICNILRKSKYYRNEKSGEIDGYGKKFLP